MQTDRTGARRTHDAEEQVLQESSSRSPAGGGRPDRPLPRRLLTLAVIALVSAVAVAATAVDGDAGAPVRTGRTQPGTVAAQPQPSGVGMVPTLTPDPSAGRTTRSAPARSPTVGPSGRSTPATTAGAGRELPRGGRTLFPRYRLVGYSGGPGSAAFGRLGVGNLDRRVREIERLGAQYAAGRRPLPVLELITVVVQSSPGRDGLYRSRIGPEVVQRYLAAARRHRALLLLNVQPGRARFLDEVKALRRWLREPDVGVALDPEWAVGPGQVPGRVFGSMTGAEIDGVAAYLDRLVADGDLPQKALVVHQLAPSVVRRMEAVRARPGVAVVKSVDGIGSPGAKRATWRRLVRGMPASVRPGFKLFFEEDARGSRLMTPREVLALRPTPEYVLYE